MSLPIVRRVRDNLHGTVDISQLEDAVLAHPYVQRLRRIKQLAFLNYVFPTASHSRFEHSLGVMHLAGKAWYRLWSNQQRLGDSLSRFPNFAEMERQDPSSANLGLLGPTFTIAKELLNSEYHIQLIRLAGMLHDLGHPAFSHSGERFMPSWQEVLDANRDQLPDYLIEYMQNKIKNLLAKGKDPAKEKVRHEIFSILMIEKLLRDVYDEHPDLDIQVEPRDLIAVIIPEIEPAPHSKLNKYGIHRLIHELISGELDIDRMDYLTRDSRQCGVVYGIFDISRIWDSLQTYHDPRDNRLHVAISFSGLAAFEDYLRARHSMYLQVYFHKTAVAAEAMMQSLSARLGDWNFPARIEGYAELDETNIGFALLEAAREMISKPADYQRFSVMVRDLLYNRRLWKRVYEVTGKSRDKEYLKELHVAEDVLKKSGVMFEAISSGTSLTRFRAAESDSQLSSNYLRIIKKGARQYPVVVPIEQHLSVIDENEFVSIHRLYVPEKGESKGENLAEKMKLKIFEELSK
jgi:uncharacterized protein